jgi:riboflavin synthase
MLRRLRIMFTGIVQATGTVASIERAAPEAATARLAISTPLDLSDAAPGASIAVDGVCLTIVERQPERGLFAADLGPETLALTTLGRLGPGARVHLERPLRMGDELGGHLVTGHVDGVGTVVARREQGGALELEISAPAAVAPALAVKGSVAVDGVSLTVNAIAELADAAIFAVTLIPHTLAVTKLGSKAEGSTVNLEGDVIAKHVQRLLAPYASPGREALEGRTPTRPMAVEASRRTGIVR